MFPNSTIPATMPDISMHYLTEEELDDLRDVSLADAIKEARRRIKVKFDKNARPQTKCMTINWQLSGQHQHP